MMCSVCVSVCLCVSVCVWTSIHMDQYSLVAQMIKNPAMLETSVQFLDQEDLLEKG